MSVTTTTALPSHICWTAADNTHLYQSSTLDNTNSTNEGKDRAKQFPHNSKEGGPPTGIFKLDYIRNCNVMGVVPHPALVGGVKKAGGDGEEKKDGGGATSNDSTSATIAIDKRKPPSTASSSSTTTLSSTTTIKLTPAQKSAADLALAMSLLTPDELKPLVELNIRGWTFDLGTTHAFLLTLPTCKHITTLKFWNASLTVKCISLLIDGIRSTASNAGSTPGGGNITKLYIDYNTNLTTAEERAIYPAIISSVASPLQVLSLRGNGIEDTQVIEMNRLLSTTNRNLLVLDLFDNHITDASCESYVKMLGLNMTLQFLNISRNQLTDLGAALLSTAFQSVTIQDKEEGKNQKKAGYHITTVKNRTLRDSNQSLKYLNMSQNHIGESGLKAWLEMMSDQVKYTPSRGMMQVGGVEVVASTLVPQRLIPPPPPPPQPIEVAEAAPLPAATIAPVPALDATSASRRKSNTPSSVTSPSATKLNPSASNKKAAATPKNKASTAIAAAAATTLTATPTAVANPSAVAFGAAYKTPGEKTAFTVASKGKTGATGASSSSSSTTATSSQPEEDDLRYPGQINHLVQVDLSGQYAPCSELLWHQLRYCPQAKWLISSNDTWQVKQHGMNTSILTEKTMEQTLMKKQTAEELASSGKMTEEQKEAESTAAVPTSVESPRTTITSPKLQADEKTQDKATADSHPDEDDKKRSRKERKQAQTANSTSKVITKV